MLRLHDNLTSGNGFKARLLLAQLGLPYQRIEYDIDRRETRTPEFLLKNLNGRIPVLELEDGTFLPESDAILWYLAEGTRFLPDDRRQRAEVLQWMFFEQYNHEPNIATVRFWITHAVPITPLIELSMPAKRAQGAAALGVMEGHLARRTFFVGERYTIADIALYAYTHVAGEGGFDLAPYENVRAWLARVAAQPGYVPITRG
jgi:glutathione S-transferase